MNWKHSQPNFSCFNSVRKSNRSHWSLVFNGCEDIKGLRYNSPQPPQQESYHRPPTEKGTWIKEALYISQNLGNFVFDMMFSVKKKCDVLLLLPDDSLQGSVVASRDRPLDFQIIPTVERDILDASFDKSVNN